MNFELTRWTGPEGLPRFDLITDGDFAPAFDRELAAAEAAMEAAAASEPPQDTAGPGDATDASAARDAQAPPRGTTP